MAVALPFIIQLLQMTPTIASAALTLKQLFDHPATVVTDSSGVALSATAIADLKNAVALAVKAAETGVQAAG